MGNFLWEGVIYIIVDYFEQYFFNDILIHYFTQFVHIFMLSSENEVFKAWYMNHMHK